MNPEEILEAAKEAGFSRDDVMPNSWMICPNESVQRFAAIIEKIIEKRTIERCAHEGWMAASSDCEDRVAAAIRKLGEQ